MSKYFLEILLESLSASNIHRSIFAIVLVTIMGYPFFATVAGVVAFNYCITMLTDFIFSNVPKHLKEESVTTEATA